MKLLDDQAKQRFADFGIPIAGILHHVFPIPQDGAAPQIIASSGFESAGLQNMQLPDEAQIYTQLVFGSDADVDPIIADQMKEFHIAIRLDYRLSKPVLLASTIDDTYESHQAVLHEPIDPLLGVRSHQIVSIASELNVPRETWRTFGMIVQSLYRCYVGSDATLTELNLLISKSENTIIATAGSLVVDDRALYRHPEFHGDSVNQTTDEENWTRQPNGLKGQIGCIANGAGVVMAMLDLIQLYGGEKVAPATYMNIANGASTDNLSHALEMITANSTVQVLLISLFEMSTSCDEMAERLLTVLSKSRTSIPVFIRLQGVNALQGMEMLSNHLKQQIYTANTLPNLVQNAVQFVFAEFE